MVKAVEANTTASQKWVVLYVRRWLKAPMQLPDGTLAARDKGTPQGSAVSPVLANLFMHYAFDKFLERRFPAVDFERYADDAVVHCKSEAQARQVWAALDQRMAEVGLRLHPAKTKIVYCKDANRRRSFPCSAFTFLGYTFRPRAARTRNGGIFCSFQPAVSDEAMKKMSERVRSWRLQARTGSDLRQLATEINPIVAGWMAYYGRFYRSALYPLLQRINTYLLRWAGSKYRRLHSYKRFTAWWSGILAREPALFAHWRWTRTFAGFR
jgi:RNA-directed DNA polymerase